MNRIMSDGVTLSGGYVIRMRRFRTNWTSQAEAPK